MLEHAEAFWMPKDCQKESEKNSDIQWVHRRACAGIIKASSWAILNAGGGLTRV